MSITDKGKQILSKIDSNADEQVMNALMRLPAKSSLEPILGGVRAYDAVLKAQRLDEEVKAAESIIIINRYQSVLLGRCLGMRIQYYSHTFFFGVSFEAQLATGLGALLGRLDSPKTEVRVVTDGTKIYGTIFIDGEGLGDNAPT